MEQQTGPRYTLKLYTQSCLWGEDPVKRGCSLGYGTLDKQIQTVPFVSGSCDSGLNLTCLNVDNRTLLINAYFLTSLNDVCAFLYACVFLCLWLCLCMCVCA